VFVVVLVVGTGLGLYQQFQSAEKWSAQEFRAPVSAQPDSMISVGAPSLKSETRWRAAANSAAPSAVLPSEIASWESEPTYRSPESEAPKESPVVVIPRPATVTQQAEEAYREGVELHQLGRLEEAAGEFEIALSLASHHYAARESLGLTLVALDHFEAASALLEEGLVLKPDHLPFAMLRARLCVEMGAFDEAIEILEAVSLDRFDAEHAAFLAALLQRSNEHDRSIALYSQVLQAEPQRAIWWMGLGISLEASRRSEDALKVYRTARAVGTLGGEPRTFVARRIRALEDQSR
jgi:MSHA biogenesis protein MshN